MDKQKLSGSCHASRFQQYLILSIMTKTMEIPALVDIEADDEWDGQTAIVDGYTGTLYLNPDAEIKREYRIRLEADKKEKEELLKLKNQTDETADGKKDRALCQYRKYERSEQCALLRCGRNRASPQ